MDSIDRVLSQIQIYTDKNEELRESPINAWKGYGLTKGQNEYDMNKIEDANETKSQNVQENYPTIKESTELKSRKEADLTLSMVLPEKLHSSDEVLSGSEPNEMIGGQEKSGRQDIVQQPAASQSDEWKMNVSGSDLLPENGYAPSLISWVCFIGYSSSSLREQKPQNMIIRFTNGGHQGY
ncbi:hypothetical protein L1987_06936 [Smallanthus sonchifolius]|uniref:Uncharacterized protein n=1 Tax=Smallanthus sonchifolius TaxID=185202 RepID=A0ACB9JZI5_9ASTR|nr:hypothetical protein L1987_06936 [Smallanthus sonchifolius]